MPRHNIILDLNLNSSFLPNGNVVVDRVSGCLWLEEEDDDNNNNDDDDEEDKEEEEEEGLDRDESSFRMYNEEHTTPEGM